MTFIKNLRRIVHKKERQRMDDLPVSASSGVFAIKDPLGTRLTALIIYSATVQYLYRVDEDAVVQLPSFALGGTFGAGACGSWGLRSNTLTATGGTTTTLTLTTNISNLCIGRKIRFLTGANAGKYATISDVKFVSGGTHTLYFTGDGLSAVANTDTFVIDTGMYYIMNAGTIAANIFKSYDPLTGVVTTLSNTGLPTTRGTDGRLIGTPSYVGDYATGTATSGTSTTLVNTGKTWTVNQWANYQVKITAGTGAGQIRTISSNTATTLTVSSAWTVAPDATSVYSIQSNDDYLYLVGNNAVTMYRYQKSTNTWTTITPTVARLGGIATGGGANWVSKTGSTAWADENNNFDGRFIYSFRGGASNWLDRYDIALNKWEPIVYINQFETFTTGSSYDVDGNRIYIRKDATHRFFYYDVIGDVLYPLTRNLTPDGAAVVGDKLFTVTYQEGGEEITYLYTLQNSGVLFYRMAII